MSLSGSDICHFEAEQLTGKVRPSVLPSATVTDNVPKSDYNLSTWAPEQTLVSRTEAPADLSDMSCELEINQCCSKALRIWCYVTIREGSLS